MKVGIDLRFLDNPAFATRGIGRYIVALLSRLLILDEPREFKILITPRGHSTLPEQIKNHNKVSFVNSIPIKPFSKAGILSQSIILPLKISQISVDLWHFPVSEIAPPWLPKPFVVTLHDLAPVVHRPRYSGRKGKIYLELQRQIFKNSSHIISVSNYSAKDLLEYFKVRPEKVTVIYHGIDRDIFFAENTADSLRKIKDVFQIDSPYFLYVGGFDPRKQVDQLLVTYERIKNGNSLPHKLVLVGAITHDCIPLFKLVSELKLYQDVLFLDYVSDDSLRSLYSAATALLFPSTFEGFGLPVLEAVACSTAVITFMNSSIVEIVSPNPLIRGVSDFDSFRVEMLRLIESETAEPDMLPQVKTQLGCFTWEKAAMQTASVYEILYRRGAW